MLDIKNALQRVIKSLFDIDLPLVLTRPDEQFGDFATNVALQLAGQLGKNPREIAEQIVNTLKAELGDKAKQITVAGPGFINITLADELIAQLALQAPKNKPQTYKNKVVVAEYSDPNPFKVLHAGHLYTSVVGFAIANLLEAAGGQVHRVNYGGDVGLHVGKTIYSMLIELGGEHFEKLADIAQADRSEWMAKHYVAGTRAYQDDEQAKAEIVKLNKRIYQLHVDKDHDTPLAKIYWTCRQWSYDYFDEFYALIGTPFERYYPESEVVQSGLQTVREQLDKGVYKQSNGAVVFDGEAHGLHTRVFITSEGIPTYEAKEVGLIMHKKSDYNFDQSVIITGNEQEQYMEVVLKSIEQFAPELVAKTKHFTHGMVKLKGGVKMSSRAGNILRAIDVLDAAAQANMQATARDDERVVLGAVKYSFLKQRMGGDIIYDPAESVSLDGNSGPYLQYAHARACSILQKTGGGNSPISGDLQPAERSLARKISEYSEVIERAITDMMPHHVCTYLYELAQEFNRFYEKNRVLDDPRQTTRQELVRLYAAVLKDGLDLLNIPAPDRL